MFGKRESGSGEAGGSRAASRPRLRKLLNLFSHSTQGSSPRMRRVPKLTVRQASVDERASEAAAERRASEEGREGREPPLSPASASLSPRRFPLLKQRSSQHSSSSSDGLWRPTGYVPTAGQASEADLLLQWRSQDGEALSLGPTPLHSFHSPTLRSALHSYALQRLRELLPGLSITPPKDGVALKAKRQKYRKIKAHTVNVMEKKGSVGKEGQKVFGVSLAECLEKEGRGRGEGGERTKSLDLHLRAQGSQGSLSSQQDGAEEPRAASEEQLNGGHRASGPPSPAARQASEEAAEGLAPSRSVPSVVESCTDYLRRNGLSTVGLFRVAGSAKRCRQMRVEMDSGKRVLEAQADDPPAAHDIATLLKEYLRDLPEPLLSEELFPAFLGTAGLGSDEAKVDALRCLLALLPLANLDTLLVLLHFLHDVADHAYDTVTDQGLAQQGNKMDALNLATIFAPSLLRSSKPPTQLSASPHPALIPTVELLIGRVEEVLAVPGGAVHQILLAAGETDGEAVDGFLEAELRRRQRLGHSAQPPEHLSTTVFYTSQEQHFPDTLSVHGTDMVLKTKTVSTHRILYKVQGGIVVGTGGREEEGEPEGAEPEVEGAGASPEAPSLRPLPPLPGLSSEGLGPEGLGLPELELFIDDDVAQEEPPLIDPTRIPPSGVFARLKNSPAHALSPPCFN